MTPIVLRYPEDLTGESPNNLVLAEEHETSNRRVRAIAPFHGPFYSDSVKVVDKLTGQPLVRNQDFYCAEYYEIPSVKSGKEVCAIILITNEALVSTQFLIDYQAVGGEFSYSYDAIAGMFNKINNDDRPVAWGDILNRPPEHYAAPHRHDVGDTFGWEYVVAQLEQIRRAILLGDSASHDEIFQYIDRRVENEVFPAIEGVADDLLAHATNTANPHSVTKAQVGLGAVENFPLASQPQAEEGISHSTYMTPLRTAQAINEQAGKMLNAHIDDKDNPHEVTKAQVGLGNLPNSISPRRDLDSNETLATSKALFDHIANGDHDEHYVRYDGIPVELRIEGGRLEARISGSWRVVYPPQWQ